MTRAGAAGLPQAAAAALFLLIVLAPIAAVLQMSWGEPPWRVYAHIFGRPELLGVFAETMIVAFLVSAIGLLLSLPTALFIGLGEGKRRQALIWIVAICGFAPFLVRAYGYAGILGEGGPVQYLLSFVGIPDALIGTRAAVVLLIVHAVLPNAIILITASISRELKSQLAAAAVLGASPAQAALLITVPALAPAIAAAFGMMFVISAGAFVAPALIGGGRETLAGQVIYLYAVELYDLDTAAAMAVVLSAITTLVLLVSRVTVRTRGAGRANAMLHAAGWLLRRVPRSVAAGFGQWIAVLTLMIIVAPFPFVIAVSLQSQPMLALPAHGLSLRWYQQVFSDSSWLTAGLTTLRIALVASVSATFAAYWIARQVARGGVMGRVFLITALVPAIMPALMYGVGLYLVAVWIGLLNREVGVAIAHTLAALPISTLVMSAGLARYDSTFEEAAQVLGANRFTRIVGVRLPLIAAPLGAALLLSLLASLEEVVFTLFVGGTDTQTIALRMWSSANQSIGPELAVPSTLLLLVSVVGATIALSRAGGPIAGVRARDADGNAL